MKNIIIIIFISLTFYCLADPDWEIVVYTNSTVAYSRVTIDDIPAATGDILGAFIENECRGIAEIFISDGEAYGIMNIQGDIPEQVSFQVWDQSIDTICSVEYITTTQPGDDIGYPPNFLPIEAYSGNPINHYPVMSLPLNFIIPEDIPTSYDFGDYCYDEDNDPLTINGIDSDHIFVSASGLIVTISSAPNWVGFEYVTFWLSDGSLSVHDSVQVYVAAVNDPPVITDTYPATGAIEVEQNDPVSFAVMAQDIVSAISYSWFVDDELQSSEDYILNYFFPELGIYEVRCIVADESYQVEADWQVTVNIEPVSENTLDNYLKISPNPCSDRVTIEWTQIRDETARITLYDIRGRKVMNFNSDRSGYVTSSEVRSLPAGIYLVNIKSPNLNITRKLTICKN